MGLFEKRRADALPESLKILFNNCFVFLKDERLKPRRDQGR
jgi:hypothetical protein